MEAVDGARYIRLGAAMSGRGLRPVCRRCLSTSLTPFVFVKDEGTGVDYFRCRRCGYVWTETEKEDTRDALDDRPPGSLPRTS
jgi:hypothetical protein